MDYIICSEAVQKDIRRIPGQAGSAEKTIRIALEQGVPG